jgi:hemin uptake protein HemP
LTYMYWLTYLGFDMQNQKETISSSIPFTLDAELTRPPACRVLSSATLLGPDGRLLIEHDSQIYSLQRTKAGKLILTK